MRLRLAIITLAIGGIHSPAALAELQPPEVALCGGLLSPTDRGGDGRLVKYYGELIELFRTHLGDEAKFDEWIAGALERADYFRPPVLGGGGNLWEYLVKLESILPKEGQEAEIRRYLERLARGTKAAIQKSEKAIQKTRVVAPLMEPLRLPNDPKDDLYRVRVKSGGQFFLFEKSYAKRIVGYDAKLGKIRYEFPGVMKELKVRPDLAEAVQKTPDGFARRNLRTGKETRHEFPKAVRERARDGMGDPHVDWKSRRVYFFAFPSEGMITAFAFDLDRGHLLDQFRMEVPWIEGEPIFSDDPRRMLVLDTRGQMLRFLWGKGIEPHDAERVVGAIDQPGAVSLDEKKGVLYVSGKKGIHVFAWPPVSNGKWEGKVLAEEGKSAAKLVTNEESGRGVYFLSSFHGANTNQAALFDLRTGKTLLKFEVPETLLRMEVRPDLGLAILGWEGRYALWNLQTDERKILEGQISHVSPDFKTLVAHDEWGRLWKVDLRDLGRVFH